MNTKETLLTEEGLEKLKAELKELETVDMVNVSERIKEARAHGDLKENSEYHAAKDHQGMLASRIRVLEDKIRHAKLIEGVDTSYAHVGTAVTVVEVESDREVVYTLTGAAEADPLEHKIAYDSPIGTALCDAKIGDSVSADLPRGALLMRIKHIEAAG